MGENQVSGTSTTAGLPVAPSMGPSLDAAHTARNSTLTDRRVLWVSLLSVALAVVAALVARGLTGLIGLITNIAFYGRFSTSFSSPAGHTLGLWVVLVPVVGGVIVGVMARYGSKAIRGHGIPEAMEQVLFNESRIPARMTFLKPLSAAVAIGTGGPFGAEGPIIATGGALGSLIGQVIPTTADERKTLLAAGAAAGMSATFGCPVAAVLLAIELLLFEYRSRSMIPVALATVTAAGVRAAFVGSGPAFAMVDLTPPSGPALGAYVLVGALVGVASVYLTKLVYWIEDAFERLPIHWMWWPALGGLAVGMVGYVSPHTLGVGYDNIDNILSGDLAGKALVTLCTLKLVSWAVSLGSGTSGGTLAPLFTLGGGLGGALGAVLASAFPHLGVDPRLAALVGMASMFSGASRALLASVVFAFETTRQPLALLPLLGGGAAAYALSSVLMRTTIMTEKLARRGARVPSDYSADLLERVLVRDIATCEVVALRADQSLAEARHFVAAGNGHSVTAGQPEAARDAGKRRSGGGHQGFPVLDASGALIGVVTHRNLEDGAPAGDRRVGDVVTRPPVVVLDTESMREAADRMLREDVGRLVVVHTDRPGVVRGILTRSDVLGVHKKRLDDAVPQRALCACGARSRFERDIPPRNARKQRPFANDALHK